MKKIAIISGGSSIEFQVSLKSSFYISEQLSKDDTFDFFNIIILPEQKKWIYLNDYNFLKNISYNSSHNEVFQIGQGKINNIKIDCAILNTFGTTGEDGELQGFLKMNKIKFTGSDILASAISLDKQISKSLVQNMGIEVVPHLTLYQNEPYNKSEILEILGNNIVVKISNGGSSIGVFQTTIDTIDFFISKAFSLSPKILLEKKLIVRELSIGFISNNFSLIGEDSEPSFHTFESKYKEGGREMIIPAKIEKSIENKIIFNAKQIKKYFGLENFGRIDFFLDTSDTIYFNEVNSLPGMTKESIFPKLWIHSGQKNFLNVLKSIIEDAINRDI